MRKLLISIFCVFLMLIFSAAVKAKKTTASKKSKETLEINNRIEALKAQNTSLTAKVEKLEKDLKKLKNTSNTYFIISIAASGAAFILVIILIAGVIGKNAVVKHEKEGADTQPGIEKHYEDIEYHVLNDWQNIWFHPENIDMKLYDDLRNHFPELYSEIEDWKTSMNSRQEIALDLGRELALLHPAVETMPCVYMLGLKETNLFIEENEIKSGIYTCAHFKADGQGSKDIMEAYYEACMKILSKKPYTGMNDLTSDLSCFKNSIDLKIRKIKFTRVLPGACSFLA